MRRCYPAVITRDGDAYGIVLPDFPGCAATAPTPEKAIVALRDALADHLLRLVEEGVAIAEPTPIEVVAAAVAEAPGGGPGGGVVCVTLMSTVIPGRLRRYNVCLDEGLVAEIDRRFGNRSRFLAEAARAELARRPDPDPQP